MPTSTEEALRDFFTKERLEYYRDLHERFPLWCGDWPEPECLQPEYADWSHATRREKEYYRITSGRERLAFLNEEGKRSSLLVAEASGGSTTIAFSALDAAILRAIVWCFQKEGGKRIREEDPLPPDVVKEWADGLMDLINPKSRRWMGAIPVQHPEPVNSFCALHLRRRILNAPIRSNERRKLVEELEEYWIRIGREIGVIPTVGKGGPTMKLADEFLAGLLTECESLASAMVRFKPDPEDIQAVRELASVDRLTDLQIEVLESLTRKTQRGEITEQKAGHEKGKALTKAVSDHEALDLV